MRTPAIASNAVSVVTIGLDSHAMSLVREALGAVMPAASAAWSDAVPTVRKLRPDLVVVGFDADVDEALRLAPQIQDELAHVTLVALSAKADPDRIRSAMRSGYREYVVLPVDAELLRQAAMDARGGDETVEEAGSVVTLWGSKGGVGTTFLGVNVAAELAPVHRVCVVDLDFSMGDVAAFLDLQPSQSITDVLRHLGRLDERMLAGSVAVHASKVHVLAQPTELDQREDARGDAIMRVLGAVAAAYQYAIVDCGSRMDEAALMAASVSDRLLLVTTPDVPGVRNAYRRLQLLEGLGIERDRVHLVVNKWDRKNPSISLADIASNLGRPVDATLPFDRSVERAVNEGKLLRDVDGKGAAARDLQAMIGLVTDGEVAPERKPSGPFRWFFRV
jgi:pilus assembly protein CpaE